MNRALMWTGLTFYLLSGTAAEETDEETTAVEVVSPTLDFIMSPNLARSTSATDHCGGTNETWLSWLWIKKLPCKPF